MLILQIAAGVALGMLVYHALTRTRLGYSRRAGCSFVAISLLLAGCIPPSASVHTTSMHDPGNPAKHFTKIMVAAATADLALQVRAESSVVRAARRITGSELIPSHVILMPQRQYSDSERSARLAAAGIQAVLVLADGTIDPPTFIAQSNARAMCFASWCSMQSESYGQTRQDRFTIVSRVFDLGDATLSWMGSTRVVRSYASDSRLIDLMAEDVVHALVKDGVLPRPAP